MEKLEIAIAVETLLPAFAGEVRRMAKEGRVFPKTPLGIAIHQDSFAAALSEDELVLLGMAIKYAGEFGVGVLISGKNGNHVSDAVPPESNCEPLRD